MEKHGNEVEAVHGEEQPNIGSPEQDETRVPIADYGYGPLDSDDIEWLIESGAHWMPSHRL